LFEAWNLVPNKEGIIGALSSVASALRIEGTARDGTGFLARAAFLRAGVMSSSLMLLLLLLLLLLHCILAVRRTADV
jgi:hypothetical protein